MALDTDVGELHPQFSGPIANEAMDIADGVVQLVHSWSLAVSMRLHHAQCQTRQPSNPYTHIALEDPLQICMLKLRRMKNQWQMLLSESEFAWALT